MPAAFPAATRPWVLVLSAALASACLAGCSGQPKTYPAKGKVVFKEDGRPVPAGAVRFEPVSNPNLFAWGEIQKDGTFTLSTRTEGDGALAGEHRVAVEPPNSDETKVTVDQRYQNPDTSGLRFTVRPDGENHFTVQVERLKRR